MGDMERLLNIAACLYAQGQSDVKVVMQMGTLRVPMDLVGFDEERREILFHMRGRDDRMHR